MAEDVDPKPRREIRIPVPDMAGIRASASEFAAKAGEKKENAFAALGGWIKAHPLAAAVITIVLLQFMVALVRFPPH